VRARSRSGRVNIPPDHVSEVDHLRADLKRYGKRPLLREPSVYAVVVYRLGRWNDERVASRPGRAAGRMLYLLGYLWIRSVLNIEIPKEAAIGPGLRVYHQGPVVVHPGVRAGAGLTVRHGVTLGERRMGSGVPSLGDDVELGVYCQVLGPITVGSQAAIGALALVIEDVPSGMVVTGKKGNVNVRGPRPE
jgi:serine O-acetyltransferase